MTYHINQIDNNSNKSVALTNPAANPNGRDSRITLPGVKYKPANAVMVNFIEQSTTVPYNQAVSTALNIYTKADNWCFWDDGDSQLLGVREDDPNINISLYKGKGGNLKMTIAPDGVPSFTAN
jgi:hypothetical protein